MSTEKVIRFNFIRDALLECHDRQLPESIVDYINNMVYQLEHREVKLRLFKEIRLNHIYINYEGQFNKVMSYPKFVSMLSIYTASFKNQACSQRTRGRLLATMFKYRPTRVMINDCCIGIACDKDVYWCRPVNMRNYNGTYHTNTYELTYNPDSDACVRYKHVVAHRVLGYNFKRTMNIVSYQYERGKLVDQHIRAMAKYR